MIESTMAGCSRLGSAVMIRQLPVGLSLALALVITMLALAGTPAGAQERWSGGEADYSEFYDELEPHGVWVRHREFGHVWLPNAAEDQEDWRPYTRGHWAHTEEHGWYWVSDEPFGWATYHYGRWFRDGELGWAWVPGNEWAPAWVAWRHGEEFVGWAPLPPDAIWEPERERVALRSGFMEDARYLPYWVFVRPRFMGVGRLHRYTAPVGRNASIVRSTSFAARYGTPGGRIYNYGLDLRLFGRAPGSPGIPLRRIVAVESRGEQGVRRSDGGAIQVYRPRISATGAPVEPRNVTTPEARAGNGNGGGWGAERRRPAQPGAGAQQPSSAGPAAGGASGGAPSRSAPAAAPATAAVPPAAAGQQTPPGDASADRLRRRWGPQSPGAPAGQGAAAQPGATTPPDQPPVRRQQPAQTGGGSPPATAPSPPPPKPAPATATAPPPAKAPPPVAATAPQPPVPAKAPPPPVQAAQPAQPPRQPTTVNTPPPTKQPPAQGAPAQQQAAGGQRKLPPECEPKPGQPADPAKIAECVKRHKP